MDILTSINPLLSTHRFAYWAFDQVALVACLPRDVLLAFENSDLLPKEYLCT